MEFVGGRDGEWCVFNIRLVADSANAERAAVGKGGCNVNAYGWIKQKKIN